MAKFDGLEGRDTRFEELESFKKIKEIEDSKTKIRQRLDQKVAAEISQQLDFTRYLYLDFVRVFLMMVDTVCCEEMRTGEYPGTNRKGKKAKTQEEQIARGLVESFFKDLVYNTEQIAALRRVVQNDINASQGSGFWIPLDFVNDISELLGPNSNWQDSNFIKTVKDETKSEQYIIRNWMHFLNLSEDAVYACLVPGAFSQLTMSRISYCLGLRALLTYCLESSFHPFLLGDFLRGRSGLPRFFDGVIRFTNAEAPSKIYLTKTSSFGTTGISIINDFCFAIRDVQDILDRKAAGILFVPGYPTPDTLKMELHWKDSWEVDVTVLYLADFYELFRIWDSKRIEIFLAERTK